MAIASVLQNSFKAELLGGYHSFNSSGDTPVGSAFKLALFLDTATITAASTAYAAGVTEVATATCYTQG